MKMAEYYVRRGLEDLALREYWAVVNSSPLYIENYLVVARVLIEAGALEQAWPFLERSLQIRSNGLATAKLLMKLTYAYLKNNQVREARRIFARLRKIKPELPGLKNLAKILR